MKYSKIILFLALAALCACGNKRELNTKVSNTTGWNYNDKRSFNFQASEGRSVAPIGMVPIEGGTFTIGETDEFITAPRNNAHRSITVSSFYMDKYEITNLNWQEYVNWTQSVFGAVAPELVEKAKPNPLVWQDDMAYNEPLIQNYFESTMFSFYPVVGVTWEQAMRYCQWRTDRVNELLLIQAGLLTFPDFASLGPIYDEAAKDAWEAAEGYWMDPVEVKSEENGGELVNMYRPSYEYIRDKFVFNTEKYFLVDTYNPTVGRKPLYNTYGEERKANRADGMLVIDYRLPTEAEWEFAAYAPVAGEDGLTIEGKIYPWSGYHPRDLGIASTSKGLMQANFVRARGDMMGVSGALNDAYVTTAPVDAFAPNDFGLYNMAGNVNEWVMDVYRETTNQEFTEYNSFRGNMFTQPVVEDGHILLDSLGCVLHQLVKNGDKRTVRDGDMSSQINTLYPLDPKTSKLPQERIKHDPTDILTPQITANTRVYKGGSWNDRIYWLNPSTRRYLEQDQCSNTIGFRCAMSALGDQITPELMFKKK